VEPGTARSCAFCGASLHARDQRCRSCGRYVTTGPAPRPGSVPSPPAGPARASFPVAKPHAPLLRPGLVKVLGLAGVVGLAVVALVVVVGRFTGEPTPPPARLPADDPHREAVEACERFVRQEVKPPDTVRAVQAAVYSAEGAGVTAVSGRVEIQPVAGTLQRKHYFCSVRRTSPSELVLVSLRVE